MALRKRLSQLAGAGLGHAYRHDLSRGRIRSLRFGVYRGLPRRVLKWADYRVFEAGDSGARVFLRRHQPLAGLPLPEPKSWSISSITAVYLHRLLLDLRPKRILEFGSGLSTVVFANYAAEQSGPQTPQVFSLDHDFRWLQTTGRRLASVGLRDHVRLLHAPLKQQVVLGNHHTTYSVPAGLAADCSNVDFLFIDGPPHTVGRAGCLPLAAPWLANDATLLLDDAYRRNEWSAWQAWRRQFGSSIVASRMLLTDRGLAMGRWQSDRTAAPASDAADLQTANQVVRG